MGDRRFSIAQKDTPPRGESPITAAQYEELRAFDAALHVGQRVHDTLDPGPSLLCDACEDYQSEPPKRLSRY
jgi:hypothetical protein